MFQPLVIKLGGSLMDIALEILQELKNSNRSILIIPGGGIFADAVRALNVSDDTSHWMAILGMEQYGWYLSEFGVPVTDTLALPENGVQIFLPYKMLRKTDPLPHSWDVTSDSIAAFAAAKLSADLLLLKSVDGTTLDAVDPFCKSVLEEYGVCANILNARVKGHLSSYLHGEDVPLHKLP